MADPLFLAQSELRLDGRRLLDIVRRRSYLLAATTVLAPIIAFVYLARRPPVFKAQTSIVIEQSTPQYLGTSFRDVVDAESSWWSSQEQLATQYRIIQSRATSRTVAQSLCSHKLPNGKSLMVHLTGSIDCTDENVEKASQGIITRLEVEPVKDSRVVLLTVKDADAHAAALLANTVAETYVTQNLARRLDATQGAATWLGLEYGDLTDQLNAAERALVDFKKRNGILSIALEDQQNELSQSRRRIVEELITVQLKLVALNAQKRLYANLGQFDPLKDGVPQLQDNPLIQKLKESYAQEYQKLIELRGKYLEKHPAVIAQEGRVEVIRHDIQNEAHLSQRSLEGAITAATKQEHDLAAKLDDTTRRGLAIEAKAIEYNRLKRTFERLQKLSETVGGREKESALAAHLKANNVRILDRALVPGSALRPNPLLVGAIAMVLGFLLGFALAFIFDLIDSTVKTQEDIEERIRLPFLGVIPRIQASERLADGSSLELYIHGKPRSAVAECCRAIRTSLMFMSPDKPLRCLLITSGEPQEGKSTVAVNLAVTMAQSGQRVLLVDTDMRRPRMHKIFKLQTTHGFSSLVAGEGPNENFICRTDVDNLWVLPCGPIPPTPAELLQSERCRSVVAELSRKFDRVLFDSPPLGVVTDAAILSQLCDGTVLVAKTGKTSRELLLRSRKMLLDLKANILGCVLNDLDLQSRSGYGYRYYHYHYRYGRYYQEEPSSASASSSLPPA